MSFPEDENKQQKHFTDKFVSSFLKEMANKYDQLINIESPHKVDVFDEYVSSAILITFKV